MLAVHHHASAFMPCEAIVHTSSNWVSELRRRQITQSSSARTNSIGSAMMRDLFSNLFFQLLNSQFGFCASCNADIHAYACCCGG